MKRYLSDEHLKLLKQGFQLMREDKFDNAILVFNKLIEMTNDSFLAYQARSLCWVLSDDDSLSEFEKLDKVVSDMESALEISRDARIGLSIASRSNNQT